MLSGDNSILSKVAEGKTKTEEKGKEEQIKLEVMGSISIDGTIDVAILKTNLTKIGATVIGNNLPLAVTLGGQGYTIATNGNVTKTEDTPVSSFGYNSTENCFIGQKSIGKIDEGEEDNSQRSNWDASKNGYKFTAGHFIYIEEYDYYDLEQGRGVTGNVYLCWDDDYGAIGSVADLCDYADTNEAIVTWDVFDASSGTWVYSDCRGPG